LAGRAGDLAPRVLTALPEQARQRHGSELLLADHGLAGAAKPARALVDREAGRDTASEG
jgi:hypothetical protein